MIICLENPFREIHSKINISKFEKTNVSAKMGKNENSGFYLINYAKNTVKIDQLWCASTEGGCFVRNRECFYFKIIHLIFCFYLWHFKKLWFDFKIHMIFQQSAVKRLLRKAKNRATSSLQNASCLVCVTSCQTTCWHKSLVLILK